MPHGDPTPPVWLALACRYTQWLNRHGKVEADLTVTKMGPDRFMVVASDNMHGHTQAWMRRHVSSADHVFIADMSGAEAQLNIQGAATSDVIFGCLGPILTHLAKAL